MNGDAECQAALAVEYRRRKRILSFAVKLPWIGAGLVLIFDMLVFSSLFARFAESTEGNALVVSRHIDLSIWLGTSFFVVAFLAAVALCVRYSRCPNCECRRWLFRKALCTCGFDPGG